MIKLTVHESVEAALQKAFPKPAAAAKRALAKYISVVESMLFDALQRGQTPEQRKLGLYAISLDQLANKGGQIGPKKIPVHKWLFNPRISGRLRARRLKQLVDHEVCERLQPPKHAQDHGFDLGCPNVDRSPSVPTH